jgi:ribose transport system ATP-binding protein
VLVTAPAVTTELLVARNFSKSFYGREVLRGLDLTVTAGEVHALLGQNGSGKSTFIKCLSGYHAPEPGAELVVAGSKVHVPIDPTKPRVLGLAFVHQQLGLANNLTVLENLQVGRFRTGAGWRIRWRDNEAAVRRALARIGVEDVSPHALVGSLSEVQRAMVTVARAFQELDEIGSGVIVLDEPTAYLPRDGVEHLFEAIGRVKAAGSGVLFVTHRLDEVRLLADRVTVLRDGVRVATADATSLGERDLVELIVGRSLTELYPVPGEVREDVVLEAENVTGDRVSSFSLRLHRGETVGVTGLVGMGQESVPYLLFGSDRATAGRLTVNGTTVGVPDLRPRKAMKLGLSLVPADRLKNGGVGPASVRENVTVTVLDRYFRYGRINRTLERRAVTKHIDQLEVRPPDPEHTFAELSGGNQQKVVLAKWFMTEPSVLLLHEPTYGIDVGTRQEVFRHIRGFTERGGAVLIASTEYEDLAKLCDRVIVFRDGRPVAELYGEQLTPEAIVEQAFLVTPTERRSA